MKGQSLLNYTTTSQIKVEDTVKLHYTNLSVLDVPAGPCEVSGYALMCKHHCVVSGLTHTPKTVTRDYVIHLFSTGNAIQGNNEKRNRVISTIIYIMYDTLLQLNRFFGVSQLKL